jgi:hypothetical protein
MTAGSSHLSVCRIQKKRQNAAQVLKVFPLDYFIITTTRNPWQIRDTDSAQVLGLIERKNNREFMKKVINI